MQIQRWDEDQHGKEVGFRLDLVSQRREYSMDRPLLIRDDTRAHELPATLKKSSQRVETNKIVG